MGRRVLAAALLLAFLLLPGTAASRGSTAAGAPLAAAAAKRTGLSTEVPYMGVDTWYAFWVRIDQAVVVRFTNEVVRRGLKRAGYRIVWIDAGWWQGQRNRQGQIVVNRQQWPYGMKWLTSYIHSKGLLAGIYTDAGLEGCQNAGSYSHYRRDVDTFARWGFDAVKVDFCGGDTLRLNPRTAYRAFARAIRDDRPHRPMLFAICNGAIPHARKYNNPSWAESAYASYSFAHSIATSWRTGPDEGVPGDVPFTGVMRNITLDAKHPKAAGHGHWNDPDYLAPDQGLTRSEARAQFTMWVILAAPLMLSANLGEMPANLVRMYENRQAIAIDRDPLAVQGREMRWAGGLSVWVKPLYGGSVAVAFLNRGAKRSTYTVTRSTLGIPAGKKNKKLTVENIWQHHFSRTAGLIRVVVPARGAVLLRVSPR